MKFVTLFASFIFCSATNMVAQPNTVQLQVSNQPAIPVVLGQVKGDKFVPVDSSMVQPATSSSPTELKQQILSSFLINKLDIYAIFITK